MYSSGPPGAVYGAAVPQPPRRGRPRWLFALLIGLVLLAVAGTVGYLRPWAGAPERVGGTAGWSAASAPASAPGRTVTILGAGDILAHPELWEQARRDGHGTMDFVPMLAGAQPTVSAADLALCHLETPLAPPGGPYQGYPRFSVPQEVLPALKTVGYDGCSTASNHSIDQGYDGIRRSLDAMDRVGLGHAGTYRDAREATRPRLYDVHGVPVAHLSYTFGLNGLSLPVDKPWEANLIDPQRIARDAAAARAAGAQIVVVSLHWGTEYRHDPDERQLAWAREVAKLPDVDLVFGHHAHVVQPVERVDGKWIVYGMGNQIARHADPIDANRDGTMVRATFSPADGAGRWRVTAIEAIPTWVDLSPGIRLVDLSRALADPALPADRRRVYQASLDRTRTILLSRGGARAGLTVRAPAK